MDKEPEKKPAPTIGDDNYRDIIARMSSMQAELDAYKKRLDDVTAMNRSLLATHEPPAPKEDSAKRHEELEQLLKEGLRNA